MGLHLDVEFDDEDIIVLAESYMAQLEHSKGSSRVPTSIGEELGFK